MMGKRWIAAAVVVAAGLLPVACGSPQAVESASTPATGGVAGSGGVTTGSAATATQKPKPKAAPAKPAEYVTKEWKTGENPDPESPDYGADVDVPKGWSEEKKSETASDFVDPTGQLRLRIDLTASLERETTEQLSVQNWADVEISRVDQAEGYQLISNTTSKDEQGRDVVELVYRFTRDGAPAEATFWFTGGHAENGNPDTDSIIGIHYPVADKAIAKDVLKYASESVDFTI